MPRTPLLFAYDASAGARHAIRAASELFDGGHALVLHVGETPSAALVPAPGGGVPVPPQPAEVDAQTEQAARAVADEGVELAAAAGFRAQPLLSRAAGPSGIAREILAAADEHDVGLIVLGSRGRSGIAAAILGSVANAVVHGTERPTLTVPEPKASDS